MDDRGSVVCGYDGSPGALEALRWAAGEAQRRERLLQVVIAADLVTPVAPGRPMNYRIEDDSVLEQARQGAERAVAEVTAGTGCRSDVRVSTDSATRLLRSLSSGAALVVVGSRGLGGFARLVLGSVSEAVAEHSACPVVVVRPRGELPEGPYVGSVVLAVDGSAGASIAARFAFEIAARRGLQLVAVHVSPADPPTTGIKAPILPRTAADPPGEVTELLDEAVREGTSRYPDVDVRTVAWNGHTVDALSTASAGAALMVVGNRGRSNLTAALLGSVSRGVLRHAGAPVAVVPNTS